MSTAELSTTGNERIHMGANMSPFDAHKVNIDDLYEEATAWLNGDGVNNEAEEKAVDHLLDLAREARKAADEARKTENEPFDTGKAEVQARYNPILKRADLIAETCKTVLKPWRDKITAAKVAAAEKLRADKEALQRKAEEEMRASSGNIAARAAAEETLRFAKDAEKVTARAERAATTGTGLRKSFRPVLTDPGKAAEHYWTARRAAFQEFLQEQAERDVRTGIRSIPGFDVIEETKAV